jgi:imidazole glycerol-phosphate synthase subunit HisF
MLKTRVIPCLLLKDGGLVKTVRFSDAKYVGDPINTIKIFNDKEVDELLLLDISASRERKGPAFSTIAQIASECFMPLCYGGGVTTLEQAKRIVGLGVEKIAINHAAIANPQILREIADSLGSQAVVVSINVKKNWLGKYRVLDDGTGKLTDLDPFDHAERAVALGAGEVLVNDVDRDGTQQGYNLDLIRRFTDRLSVPVIACGGAWTTDHLRQVVKESRASAVAAGSMFVFQGPHRAVLVSYPAYAELERLFQN